MARKSRIFEIYQYYIFSGPSPDEDPAHHRKIVDRFTAIYKLTRDNPTLFRSILLAMGNDCLPLQYFVDSMSNEVFARFIDPATPSSERRAIFTHEKELQGYKD